MRVSYKENPAGIIGGAQEGGRLGFWASKPPLTPRIIYTLGNRPQSTTLRLYLPSGFSLIENIFPFCFVGNPGLTGQRVQDPF